jgi:hypothetical protein
MKKTAGLFLLLFVMAGFRVMAQDAATPTPTFVPVSAATPTGSAGTVSGFPPTVPATPQKTPGMPPVYFSIGAGTALVGSGFGTEDNPWIDTGNDSLVNGYGASFNPSIALSVLFGVNLDPNWSVNLSLATYSFLTFQSSSSNEENIIPSLRYTFDSGWFRPYITAGYGLNFNTTSAAAPAFLLPIDSFAQVTYNTQVASNAVASGGVGLLFKIAGDYSGHAFLEAQYQQVFTSQGGFSYFPLTIGYQYP